MFQWESPHQQETAGLGITPFCRSRNSNQSGEARGKSWSPHCHISKHKNYKSSSPPFLAADLNHSQVFASDLDKSQFRMENLKNNFAAQISKVIGRKIALPRQDIKWL